MQTCSSQVSRDAELKDKSQTRKLKKQFGSKLSKKRLKDMTSSSRSTNKPRRRLKMARVLSSSSRLLLTMDK